MGAIKDPRHCSRWDCFAYRTRTGQCDALRVTYEKDCPFFKTREQEEEIRRRCKERMKLVDWNDEIHTEMKLISAKLRVAEEIK